MPNFGSHLSGPIRHTTRLKGQGERAWFKDLPVGMNDPDFVHQFIDFERVTDYSTTDYTLTSSGTGSGATINQTANGALGSSGMSVNGALLIQTGSTAGNYVQVQNKVLGWNLDRTTTGATPNIQDMKGVWFEAKFSATIAASDLDCFVGLAETAASIVGPSAVANNYVGFRVTNGNKLVRFVSSTAGAISSGSVSAGSGNSVSLAEGTLTTVGFNFRESNTVDFYINRNYMNSFNVVPTCPLAISAQCVTNAAAGRSLVLDYVYVAKTR